MTISQPTQDARGGYSSDSHSTQVVILEVYLGLAWATGACVFGCIVVQVAGVSITDGDIEVDIE